MFSANKIPYLLGAPLLIAHRGGAKLAPENTLVAFRRAVEWWWADVLEVDVQPTRDGEAVVIHDARVDRTTDGRGAVVDFTLEQLRRLDAGFRFGAEEGFPFRGSGIGIPTLGELLEAFPGRRVNIEVKDPRAGARVAAVVREARAEGRVLIAGAARESRVAAALPGVATSASEDELKRFYLLHRLGLARLYRPPVDALQLPHHHREREVPTARFVRDAHRQGLAVHVWTVDDVEEMRRLLRNGVDGIVTDRPDRLARVLHEDYGRPLPPSLMER